MNELSPISEILVVDDERFSRRVLVRTLENAGFACRECSGGLEALHLIGEQLPSLLLLDYSMPDDLNGAEVCERVRAHADGSVAQLPIIMLTGMGGEEQEIFCLQAGANDFVTKPVNPAVLKARIDTQLRLSTLRRQLEKQNAALADWRAELERDLEAARLTQQTIIPQGPPTVPGWNVGVHYQPVIQVGGDIYDWLRLPDGKLFFWIADVTGHGASAALLTALAKLLFRHAAVSADDPADILRAVNEDFRATFKGRSLLTAMGATLDILTGELVLAGAGHPPLFLLRADGRVESYQSQCPPLGLLANLLATSTTLTLAPGDGFFLYTDGFYDVVDPAGSRMDFDVFARCVEDSSGGPATAFLAKLLARLQTFTEGTPATDDLAAVVAFRER